MTESKIRAKIVETAIGWLGYNEADKSHRKIIDVYNDHKPRARGHKVKYTEAWCATFVSAVAITCGLTEIMPTECSCSKMLSLYKDKGCWQEADDYIPAPGDLVLYDWEDDGKGDNKGYPDHIGIVTHVGGGWMKIVEGNLRNAVNYRDLQINGKNIRGYCLPDYASLADEDELVERYGRGMTVKLHQLSRGCTGEEVRAMQLLLIGRGYDIGSDGADGIFGYATEEAVMACQRDHELEEDGIYGRDTATALFVGK